MKISRIKFVFLFVAFAFVFVVGSNAILDQAPDSLFGSESQETWKSVVAAIISPLKFILVGPLLPFIKFLQQDPDTPPPFFLAGFGVYWTILALVIHYILGKIKYAR